MGKMRTHAAQQISLLFDHLVGAREQRLGNGYAKLLRGFEIDDQFKLGRNLYWKVARLFDTVIKSLFLILRASEPHRPAFEIADRTSAFS